MFTRFKSRNVATILALIGIFIPGGLHKFYLRQPLWGLLYILLCGTPIPYVASAIEAVWYLSQHQDEFNHNFNLGIEQVSALNIVPAKVNTMADAIRQLESLRQDGLVSEYEFEVCRRQMLERIV